MDSHAGKGLQNPIKGSFVARYAQLCKEKQDTKDNTADLDFKSDYKKGKLRYAVAAKHLNLISAGLDTYVEAENSVVWRRDGDSIVRLDNDLGWIDELIKEENS